MVNQEQNLNQAKQQEEQSYIREMAEKIKLSKARMGASLSQEETAQAKEHQGIKNLKATRDKLKREQALSRREKDRGVKRRRVKSVKRKAGLAKDLILSGVDVFKQINFSKDGLQFLVIILSIIADLFGIIPIPLIGSLATLVFVPCIYLCYILTGHFKRRAELKIGVSLVCQMAELVLGVIGLGAIAFYTISALANYYFVLVERGSEAKVKES